VKEKLRHTWGPNYFKNKNKRNALDWDKGSGSKKTGWERDPVFGKN
jgi:hypothetical protein